MKPLYLILIRFRDADWSSTYELYSPRYYNSCLSIEILILIPIEISLVSIQEILIRNGQHKSSLTPISIMMQFIKISKTSNNKNINRMYFLKTPDW